MKHTDSQRQRLKQHFDSGKSVTRLTAFIDLGICELSSRIGELEKSGYAVAREMIKVTNRFGEEVKVMKYRKDEPCPKCGGKGWYFVNEWFFSLQGRKDCSCTINQSVISETFREGGKL